MTPIILQRSRTHLHAVLAGEIAGKENKNQKQQKKNKDHPELFIGVLYCFNVILSIKFYHFHFFLLKKQKNLL